MIRRPTLVLALLTALNLLNFIDRYVLAAVLPKVRDTLHLSNFVSGLMATVFLAGYFLTSPIFGVLGDRMRRTWLITFGIVVWSIATFASGLAQGATSMLVCRALVGVGEASFTAIAPTLIDDVTPKDKKGKYLAIFYVAQPIGAALGYLLGGALEKAYGWRAAFYFAGGPGLVLALTCLLIAEPDRGVREKADVRKAFGELWASRQYRRAILGYCAYTFAIGGFSQLGSGSNQLQRFRPHGLRRRQRARGAAQRDAGQAGHVRESCATGFGLRQASIPRGGSSPDGRGVY